MKRQKGLSASFVKRVRHSGRTGPDKYGDFHGLILRVSTTGAKTWLWRGTIHGKRRDLGLGGFPYVTLDEARDTAFEYRRLARRGGDPAALREREGVPTFRDAALATLEVQKAGWRAGGKQAQIWWGAIERHALPRLGRRRVDQVSMAEVMATILPLAETKPESARRLRQYLGAVFKWAMAQGFRQDNPAGEALTAALPKSGRTVQHQRALPHGEVADALATVAATGAYWSTKAAFAFIVHTACRSGEARLAEWHEIDLDAREWRVPANRTKTGREHRVPLTDPALAILAEARDHADTSGLVFPSARGRAMTDNTISKLLRENDIAAVPHGFRSSFRDWAGETGVAREVAEACLAHLVANRVEAAYARSSLFERRKAVMAAWSRYLTGESGKVVALHG